MAYEDLGEAVKVGGQKGRGDGFDLGAGRRRDPGG